jgi:hypothetical protein
MLGSEFTCKDLEMTPYAVLIGAVVGDVAHTSSSVRAGIAQSVKRLATGRTARCHSSNPSRDHPDWFWGPSSLLSNGYRRLFPQVKRPGCEAHHSPPTSAEIKNTWFYTATSPYALMA